MTAPSAPPRQSPREFIFFVAMISAMSALAIDIVLPAFADMREAFGLAPDATDLSWTLTSFFLGVGFGQLFAGPLADAIGRKRLLMGSMLLYAAAAVASALAPTLWMLYLARAVWGFAAAGPRILAQAMVRDRHSGDAMARVMTLVQASFMIAPIVAPVLGAGLLAIGSWRWVMLFGAVTASVLALWGMRFEESLDPAHRRSFDPSTVIRGYRTVMAHPVTRGYVLAVMFGFAAFYSFLTSTELVFDDVFDRAGAFVPYFSLVSLFFGIVAFSTNRFLQRWSGTRLITLAGCVMVSASVVLLLVALATDGQPSFWVFVVVFSVANAGHVAFFPTANSLALEPMGTMAGTAAAVLGVTTAIGAALLGSITDRAIDGTITPLAIGYVVYGSIAYGLQLHTTRVRRHRPT